MKKYIIDENTINEIREIFEHFINEGFLDKWDLELLDDLEKIEE